jgi:hypothetical protein
MATVTIRDNSIWLKHISDELLKRDLERLSPNEAIELAVDNVEGIWRRMQDGKDGRSTFGIKPDGAMSEVWKRWCIERRGETITIRRAATADAYLSESTKLFEEWNSAEDEEAFRDL